MVNKLKRSDSICEINRKDRINNSMHNKTILQKCIIRCSWMYLRSTSIICHIDRITNGTLTLTNIRCIHECKRNKNFFTI